MIDLDILVQLPPGILGVMIMTTLLLILKTCMLRQVYLKQNNCNPRIINLSLAYLFTRWVQELLRRQLYLDVEYKTVKLYNESNIWRVFHTWVFFKAVNAKMNDGKCSKFSSWTLKFLASKLQKRASAFRQVNHIFY